MIAAANEHLFDTDIVLRGDRGIDETRVPASQPIVGTATSAPRSQGRSRERLRILSNPYPRDPVRCRIRRQAGWHADREEAAFRLLQLLDFDENVGFRAVVDVATETGGVQIVHTVDGVGREGPP